MNIKNNHTHNQITGNNINIIQNSHITNDNAINQQPSNIIFNDIPESFQKYPTKTIKKPVNFTNLCGLITGILGFASLFLHNFSSATTILSYFNISPSELNYLWILPVIVCFIYLISTSLFKREIEIINKTKNLLPDHAVFIKDKFWTRDQGGNFIIYQKNASCSYPYCHGEIILRPPPSREKANHALVGICTIGDKLHSYTVDTNGIGYPHKFDWKEEPESSSQTNRSS